MRPTRVILVMITWLFAATVHGETNGPSALLSSANHWMQANLDDWVFEAVGLDRAEVTKFLAETQAGLGSNKSNSLQPAASDTRRLVASLEQYEDTEPYVRWLRSLLNDYAPESVEDDGQETTSSAANEEGFSQHPTPEQRREKWIRVLSKQPQSRRASEYVAELKLVFSQEGVPPELVWMAEVESAFNPKASSPAGAVGLFQLMPDTARSLNLSLWPIDQRKQPVRNARAAAEYLRHLHDRFGDWQLALAAYNGGETRVSKLLDKRNTRTYDTIASSLPAETQDYVPKVEATIWVREGIQFSELITAQN